MNGSASSVLGLVEAHLEELQGLPAELPSRGAQVEAIIRGENVVGGFERADLAWSRIYASLAVLARDAHMQFGSAIPLLEEIVRDVEAEDSRRYGTGAFPAYAGLPVETLPVRLTEAALDGAPVIPLLAEAPIVHEWTVFPGFAVWRRFWRGRDDAPNPWSRLREVVCSRWADPSAAPAAELPGTVAAAVVAALTVGSAVAPAALAPIAACVALIALKRGRARLCEGVHAAAPGAGEQLEALTRKLFQAEGRHDIDGAGWRPFLERALSEDFVLRRSKPGAPTETRPEMIARIEAAAASGERTPVARGSWIEGDLGVVRTGVVVADDWFANVMVFRRMAGEWRCAYWQVTRETPEDPAKA